MVQLLTWVSLVFAARAAFGFLLNLTGFRRATSQDATLARPAVSVLIPARNEEAGIKDALLAVLANRGVDLEVLVLDDQSSDATPQIVAQLAATDHRLRLASGQSLPAGWCGKQFACFQLASQAAHDELLFLDADVRLAPDAIRRSVAQRRQAGTDLLSGFPRQRTDTLGEALLIPLMYVVLLTYLPFWLMRKTKMVGASAGCGQLLLTSRQAYQQAGGHRAIRGSLHDGVTLPRAYRRSGLRTDIFDAGDVAECRMYRGFQQTWRGLLKNAHEGIAHRRLILPMTSLLAMDFVLPPVVAAYHVLAGIGGTTTWLALLAGLLAYLPRMITAVRCHGGWLAAALFPIAIVLFVCLQWYALVRSLGGRSAAWRGRNYASATT